MKSTTIVSAFLSNVNIRNDRKADKYYEYGKLILKSTCNKIIFLDDEMMERIKPTDFDSSTTVIHRYNKENSYLFTNRSLCNFHVNSSYPEKDTIEYMYTNCNKTEWIREAIRVDPFSSNNFIWVDFGIRHFCKSSDVDFVAMLNSLATKSYENVRIANIWDLNHKLNGNIFQDIKWYFAGSVFGGNKTKLIAFADFMREKCEVIMQSLQTITWEINIWYLIYLEYKDLFEPYTCNHNDSILLNY